MPRSRPSRLADLRLAISPGAVEIAGSDTIRRMLRLAGLLLSLGYAVLIVWLYATQPQTMREVTGGLGSAIGAYRIDSQAFAEGLTFFRRDQFIEARAAFARADPAGRDPRTLFYIAYAYYRQGWGRVYNDDALFAKGLETLDRAIGVAPDHRIVVDDPDLGLHTADELRVELVRGQTRELSDLNPMRVFRQRK
jgi:tetratricopeptide (TPR) repeat protein